MDLDQRPILAVTMGDPAGTGPEIIAKVVATSVIPQDARLICIGSAAMMQWAFGVIGAPCRARSIGSVAEAAFAPGTLDVLEPGGVQLDRLQMGKVQALAGQAAYEFIVTAIDLAQAGDVAAVITSAINKEALHLAGHKFDGHTELFAWRTGTRKVTMMLASGHFRVTHVSTHCALRQAVERCKTERILDVIRLTDEGIRRMGIATPHLAVAGLNPHAGEGGIFGVEEIEQIQPAIELARREGLNVYPSPVPGDTVFVRMREGREFDGVVAQYHDQGHVAAKLLDFWGGVNITLGLPIIRTSVDHGTAFDIAGRGVADHGSLVSAIQLAARLAEARTLHSRELRG